MTTEPFPTFVPPSPQPTGPALVLLSGGQDSSTALFWAARYFPRIVALGFDYGQRHAVELDCAHAIAQKAGIPFSIIPFPSSILASSALTTSGQGTDTTHHLAPSLPATWTPLRNALFLTIGASWAFEYGCQHLVIGVNATDYSGFPDCRPEFIVAMQTALQLGLDAPIHLHAPLLHLTKAEIWALANHLGVLDTIIRDTHTDYNGNRTVLHEWGYGQLDNPSSRLRAEGYHKAQEHGWLEPRTTT